jgi:hypothetical protein
VRYVKNDEQAGLLFGPLLKRSAAGRPSFRYARDIGWQAMNKVMCKAQTKSGEPSNARATPSLTMGTVQTGVFHRSDRSNDRGAPQRDVRAIYSGSQLLFCSRCWQFSTSHEKFPPTQYGNLERIVSSACPSEPRLGWVNVFNTSFA